MAAVIALDSISDEDRARIERSYRLDANGCWISTLTQNGNGYTQICLKVDGQRRMVLTHRASYVAFVGPIPDGLVLDHLCRNRACINPDHLEAVTQSVNVLRGERTYELKSECKQGHPFDAANTYARPDGRGRQCRTCVRTSSREYKRRNRAAS